MPRVNNKIIVILGTNASGKTGLGVKIAHKFKGEIISADSRQVYKYMDVGTGKDLGEYKDVSYHLINVVHPNTKFHLAKYQKLVFKAIDNILKRGKVPIIVGGTSLYLQAIVDNYNLNGAQPDKKLRQKLEKKSVEELFSELKKINSKFAVRLNNSEKNNKRRLIRYIEIMQDKGVGPLTRLAEANGEAQVGGRTPKGSYKFLVLGLTWPREILRKRIYKRLIERLEKEDMISEVENLHEKRGVFWKRLESFGLEYKYISLYLQDKLSYEEMVEKLFIATRQFAKKQMSWFKRWEKQGREINWLGDIKEAERLVREFLRN